MDWRGNEPVPTNASGSFRSEAIRQQVRARVALAAATNALHKAAAALEAATETRDEVLVNDAHAKAEQRKTLTAFGRALDALNGAGRALQQATTRHSAPGEEKANSAAALGMPLRWINAVDAHQQAIAAREAAQAVRRQAEAAVKTLRKLSRGGE